MVRDLAVREHSVEAECSSYILMLSSLQSRRTVLQLIHITGEESVVQRYESSPGLRRDLNRGAWALTAGHLPAAN